MIEILSYEENEKVGSALVGFFTVRIVEWDMTISRMCYFIKGEKTWIAMPSYAIREAEDPSKWKYFPICYFGTQRQEKFLTACKKSLIEYKQQPIKQDNYEENELLPF